MASFDFTVPIYGFDQWVGASTNNTVSYANGTTFSLNAGASLTVIDVTDDDGIAAGSPGNLFSDGFIDTPGDGSSPSTANNDQVLSSDVTINGTDFFAGDQVELEFGFTTTTGETFWVIRIDGVNVGISGPVLPTPGATYEVGGSADGSETPIEDVPCFTDGALVSIPGGTMPIEKISPGQLVMTVDNGPCEVRWVGARPVSAWLMSFFPSLRPVLIRQGALGQGLPNADILVSSQHRVMIKSDVANILFGEKEVLATAESLIDDKMILRSSEVEPVTYRHLLFDRHEILTVNGIAAESLYPGTSSLSPEAMMEIDLLGLIKTGTERFARPALRKFEAQMLRSSPFAYDESGALVVS